MFELLGYTNYIANLIVGDIKAIDHEKILSSVSRAKWERNGGEMTGRQTIDVQDRYGKSYRITVEQIL
jgi:hypothetical protein